MLFCHDQEKKAKFNIRDVGAMVQDFKYLPHVDFDPIMASCSFLKIGLVSI